MDSVIRRLYLIRYTKYYPVTLEAFFAGGTWFNMPINTPVDDFIVKYKTFEVKDG